MNICEGLDKIILKFESQATKNLDSNEQAFAIMLTILLLPVIQFQFHRLTFLEPPKLVSGYTVTVYSYL
jgi:hypothetical protein